MFRRYQINTLLLAPGVIVDGFGDQCFGIERHFLGRTDFFAVFAQLIIINRPAIRRRFRPQMIGYDDRTDAFAPDVDVDLIAFDQIAVQQRQTDGAPAFVFTLPGGQTNPFTLP